jgi:prephenate dehydrogenase
MTELFADVSKQVKDRAKFWVDIALLNPDTMARAQEILNFRNSLEREDEKEFVDFYVNMRALQARDEGEE